MENCQTKIARVNGALINQRQTEERMMYVCLVSNNTSTSIAITDKDHSIQIAALDACVAISIISLT